MWRFAYFQHEPENGYLAHGIALCELPEDHYDDWVVWEVSQDEQGVHSAYGGFYTRLKSAAIENFLERSRLSI